MPALITYSGEAHPSRSAIGGFLATSSTATLEKSVEQAKWRPSFWRRRWPVVALAGLFILGVIYATVLALNWPFTQQNVIDVLQERSVRSVTVDHFYRTYFPPGCVAEGVKFLHRKHKNKPPLIAIQKLVILGSYSGLVTLQDRLSLVRVSGMHVTVPPKQPDGKPNPIMPLNYSDSARSMIIDKIIADGAELDFMQNDPKKAPFRLIIDKLALHDVGNNRAISYRTIISDTVPPGKIRSTGKFGPWNPKNPGNTPVTGSYTFQDANLAFFKEISGTLSSSGDFHGTLGQLEAQGTADVPNFKVTDTSHTRQLATRFHAVINATNGDTFLRDVTGHFDKTTVVCKGSVAGTAGEHGKTVSLDVFANGRIEDLLKLFISGKRSPMTGEANLGAHAELPPTPQPFLTKLTAKGDFGVAGGRFTDAGTQDDLIRLSESAAKRDRGHQEDPETVVSDLKGHFATTDGTATLSKLSFGVPGAKAVMHGTYRLTDYKVDLHGVLVTDGSPSEATTGFKSFLVKAITPFFKKKASQKIVPFKITGNYSNALVGLDLGEKKK